MKSNPLLVLFWSSFFFFAIKLIPPCKNILNIATAAMSLFHKKKKHKKVYKKKKKIYTNTSEISG